MVKGIHSLKKLKESSFVVDSVGYIFGHTPLWFFRRFYPYAAYIEMTNICMARCTLCNVTCATGRKKGVMNYENFVKIIGMLPKTTKEIYMNYAGDPLINKEVFRCVKYATSKGLYVYVSTNGELLDKFTPKEICKSGLNDLAICIDGPDAKTHEFYRKNTHFDKITKATQKLNDYKRKNGYNKPNMIFQTLVNKHTYKYMDKTKKIAKKLGFDEIDYRTTCILGIINQKQFEKNFPNYQYYDEGKKYYLFDDDNKYNVYIKDKQGNYKYKNARRFCSFFNPMIFWNGDLGVCCNDPDGTLIYGNVLKEGFEKAYKKLPRRDILYTRFPLCQTCFKSVYFNIEIQKLK